MSNRYPRHSLVANNNAYLKTRSRWALIAFLAIVAVLMCRLAALQIKDHARYVRDSANEVHQSVAIPALRGGIYDRHGQILAISTPTKQVIADDFQIVKPELESRQLAPYLHRPAAEIYPLLTRHSGYVLLTNSLDLASGRKLERLNAPGIRVFDSSVRTTPNGSIATALIGGTHVTITSGAHPVNLTTGTAGLEYQMNDILGGSPGRQNVLASVSGISLPGSRAVIVQKPVPGRSIELTIDTPLQYITEQALGNQLHATGGLTGTAMVMDVRTGEILASASLVNTGVPAGNLGPISTWGTSIGVPGIEQTINNLPTSQTYEPGSVFKIIPFSAALESGAITPTTHFKVPYSVLVAGRVYHDAERHGVVDLTSTQILAQSSNIGTYMISTKVGAAGLLGQVERLGFGQTTALRFPGESSGLLKNAQTWSATDIASLPIGQTDAVTPMQLLDAYNTIANGGIFIQPKVVRAVVDQYGAIRATPPSEHRRALSSSVASTLNSMLQQVVVAGTGTNAIIPGYLVAGKTGTAQIPTPGHSSYITGAYNATFVGYAPANHPILSMVVIIQRPRTVIFGGAVAAPVFQRVMSYALHHYGITPTGISNKPLAGTASAISSDVT
ncbi:MAG: penicillin-binding protein 2 [Actinomycetota bacterium]